MSKKKPNRKKRLPHNVKNIEPKHAFMLIGAAFLFDMLLSRKQDVTIRLTNEELQRKIDEAVKDERYESAADYKRLLDARIKNNVKC